MRTIAIRLEKKLFLLLALFRMGFHDLLIIAYKIDYEIINLPTFIIGIIRSKEIHKFTSIFILNLFIKETVDVILTPIIMLSFGFAISFLFTMIVYIFIGIITVEIYDFYQDDFGKIEALKKAECENTQINTYNGLIKFIVKRSKSNRKSLILLLTYKNPGLAVLYMRKGYYLYNGFEEKNIKTYFLLNITIMNICWNTMLYLGISKWEPFWNFIKESFLYLFNAIL